MEGECPAFGTRHKWVSNPGYADYCLLCRIEKEVTMADPMTGTEVVEQSRDNSLWNTEPVVAKAAVVGVTTSVLIALGAFGLVSEDQRTVIVEQVGNITVALFVLLPLIASLVSGLLGRLSAFSPRTAARIAVTNARQASGSAPTMLTPP